jgi:5-oxoprolinase (ATP-hydrolysing)
MSTAQIRFSIDRGGTFTDVYAEVVSQGISYTEKLLSVDPAHYPDAPREGIRRILEKHLRTDIPPSAPLTCDTIQWIRMGTTVATNALLERKGSPTALVISKGFKDLLTIGDQTRPALFDLQIEKPEQLYEEVFEVNERIRVIKEGEVPDPANTIQTLSGEQFLVLQRPNPTLIQEALQKIYNKGIRSLAVVCMHSYAVYDHELLIGDIALKIGFDQISLSHKVMPKVSIVARGDTTLVDAYLSPHIYSYLQSFRAGFVDTLKGVPLLFMQSDGGLRVAEHFKGSNSILSGPAGGVVGCGLSTFNEMDKQPVIGFDMGGTSTDVSRYDGKYELSHETIIAGVRIQCPQMHIKTVAAGGGSRLFYRNNMLQVGPESAGAHPGPICYRKNGHLSITDANLFLGRLQTDHFPHIFGAHKNMGLDADAVNTAFQKLAMQINSQAKRKGLIQKSVEEIALGFLEVGNETMIRPIREISVMRGYDIKEHVLSCFGGAGGQHACAIARKLGISTIFIHRHGGILSAIGISLAQIVVDLQEAAAETLSTTSIKHLKKRLHTLEGRVRQQFTSQCSVPGESVVDHFLNLRFQGTDSSIMVALTDTDDAATEFRKQYHKEYGFLLSNREIEVTDIRVRMSGDEPAPSRPHLAVITNTSTPATCRCYFHGGWQDTPIYELAELNPGHQLKGPAIILQNGSTVLIEPGCTAQRNNHGDITIQLTHRCMQKLATALDPIQLSIFSNLFMSIGEQMGRTLQKTAISTNIKERLDFSCAVFDQYGDLVANAPHIPVHLGAMGAAIKSQIAIHGNTLSEGDVLLSNHPVAGGSHLPDLTVITPVWHDTSIVFYVASRGHHADIGGISPGSMPPFSTTLLEEGAAISSLKIIEKGTFQETELIAALSAFADPHHKPAISGARHITDNISDIKAQIASNQNGIILLEELIDKYGLQVVQAYMTHIQDNAQQAVRDMLKKICKTRNGSQDLILYGEDFLDDGSPIRLKISIDARTGESTFDFRGSAAQLSGNLNCPRAVVRSAILYCLRSLIGVDIPLNQGCLQPITLITDKDSLLNPDATAAVVGGNVLTSQRITDVILKAFGAAADSQGCTNNLSFGNKNFGYYETIGGGAGAGPHWHGQSGVHTHMTNTRITDPEVLERRYPVLLREFSIRKGSGGKGKFNGGDGLVRHIEALAPMQLSILSERRIYSPNGIMGGGNGKRGHNTLHRNDTVVDIGGKASLKLCAGEAVRIATPGGGGYGEECTNE